MLAPIEPERKRRRCMFQLWYPMALVEQNANTLQTSACAKQTQNGGTSTLYLVLCSRRLFVSETSCTLIDHKMRRRSGGGSSYSQHLDARLELPYTHPVSLHSPAGVFATSCLASTSIPFSRALTDSIVEHKQRQQRGCGTACIFIERYMRTPPSPSALNRSKEEGKPLYPYQLRSMQTRNVVGYHIFANTSCICVSHSTRPFSSHSLAVIIPTRCPAPRPFPT